MKYFNAKIPIYKIIYFPLLILLILLVPKTFNKTQKAKKFPELKVIKLPYGAQITTPCDTVHNHLEGIDSYVGEIKSDSLRIAIRYDIGKMAGFQVNKDSPGKIEIKSINEKFFLEFKYLSKDSVVATITFPDNGPSNFFFLVKDAQQLGEIIRLFKTYESGK